ncbi:MAG TPA: FtsX-like permease family protein [Lacipirellulaceae bacterium]|nr:FtsX-like permease family protein [Lacipirellulaceae bacterium]
MSIVIGVAAVVAVTISSGTTHRAFDQIFKTVAGKAQLEVSAPVGTSFNEKVVDKIREVPDVKAVVPIMSRWTKLEVPQENGEKAKRYTITAVGVDPAIDREVHDYEVVAGKPLPKSKEEPAGVLLEANFAKSQGIKVGDKVTFSSLQGGFIETNVFGLYSSNDVATGGAGAPMYMPLFGMQEFWHNRGRIDAAQIKLDPNTDEKKAEAAIAAVLPDGVSVQPPATRSAMAEETSLSTEQGMRMARVFSLLVAVFIIANTFLINVTQRRRQFGIMRAIGATRAQISGMMYREALLMGVLGTVLGSLLGVAAAHYLSLAMGTLYQSDLPPIELTFYPFLVGAGCGLGVSLIAAILPARKASHLSPLEAMRDVLPEEIEGVQWWLTGSGAALVVLSAILMVMSVLGWIGVIHTVWSACLMLVGFALLMPVALRPLSAMAMFIFRPILAVEGKLAQLQLLRHRSRTTLTVGVVFIAAATGIGLANSVIDNVNDVRNWYHKTIVADFYLRAAEPNMATGTSPDLPEGVGDEIKKVAGIKSSDALRLGRIKMYGQVVNLLARDHNEPGVPDLDIVSGDADTLRESFKNGAVAVGSVLARRAKLKVGDKVELDTENGKKSFPVAAIINDYQSGGLTLHMERSVAKLELGYEGVSSYIIKVDHDQFPEAKKQLQEIATSNGLVLENFEDIRSKVDRMMSGVVACLWAMVVLGLVVSAVGVTNTLTINVLEQTRELGLLRIVAMTQNQVRKTVFTQAMIMALLAIVPGIIAGVSIAFIINVAMMPTIGHPVKFTFHPALLLGGFAAGLVIVALAAWFPSDRAARLNLLEAVRSL